MTPMLILESDRVTVGVGHVGAMLWPVRFRLRDREVEPMHRAPWAGTPGLPGPPMLQHLSGDFLCAPFGASDLLPGEQRDHGSTANGRWREVESGPAFARFELEQEVSGSRVSKEVRLLPGHPVVYQRHLFSGGRGELPLGHHAMLRAPEGDRLNLSFSRFVWCGTPPAPVEPDAGRGRSRLLYPQVVSDLRRVRLAAREGPPKAGRQVGGGARGPTSPRARATVDLSSYPALEDSEEILLLVSDPALPVAWSAAVAPLEGWVWFALRPNGPLTATMLWMSNGGRDYPPFSGRHRRVLGIEEVTSFFHLGHRASTGPNGLREAGFRTSVPLEPGLDVRYAFGCVEAPSGFTRVRDIRLAPDQLALVGDGGREIVVPFAGDHLAVGG